MMRFGWDAGRRGCWGSDLLSPREALFRSAVCPGRTAIEVRSEVWQLGGRGAAFSRRLAPADSY